MATTLSKGFVRPDTGDRGSVWFVALENNITQLNSHDHDGTDSTVVLLTNISRSSAKQTLLAGSWNAVGDGSFTQIVDTASTTLASKDIDNYYPKFTIDTGGTSKQVFLSYTRITATTYTLLINEAVEVVVQYV